MVCAFDRIVGYLLVLLGVFGVTGLGLFQGKLLGLFLPVPANYLLFIGLGTLLVVIGFECRESIARPLTRVFGLVLALLAVGAYLSSRGLIFHPLQFGLAETVLFLFMGVAAVLASTPVKYSRT